MGNTPTKVLLLGPQHSGKSSLINSIGHYKEEWAFEKVPAGRMNTRGTECYGMLEVKGLSFAFYDTAGKNFQAQPTEGDKLFVRKCKEGLKIGTRTDNVDYWGNTQNVDRNNQADRIVLVVSATDLQDVHNPATLTLTRVAYLGQMYDLCKSLCGDKVPAVVITRMDVLAQHNITRSDVRDLLGAVVHTSSLYCISNWQRDVRELSNEDMASIDSVIAFLKG